ncbi:MAG: hypothetical protein IJB68_01970 [Ruminococcus sp.]|nr:hypothetical protein [Ruminococcus sp.]
MNELKSTYTQKNTDELMQYISESLLDLGFSPNLKGFTYVKEAIYIYMHKYYEDVKNSDVLLSISQKHSVTASSVNLTIRKSIELTWLSGRLNTKHKMFESSYIDKRFPLTNSEFIATMVEIIRINLRENDKSVGY